MKFLLCLTVLDFCFVSEMIICFRCLVSVWKYLPFFFFLIFVSFVCGVWVYGCVVVVHVFLTCLHFSLGLEFEGWVLLRADSRLFQPGIATYVHSMCARTWLFMFSVYVCAQD